MIQFLLLGLGVGGLYALAALGIVTIYRGSKTLNFAHGGIATWGAFLFVELRDGRGWHGGTALVAVVVVAAGFGALLYLAAMRPLRHTTELTRALATLGVLLVLRTAAIQVWGSEGELVRSSLPNHTIQLLGATVGVDRILLLLIAVAATSVLAVTARTWRFQLMTRALAENERAAASLGASPVLLGAANWALGSVLAATAGALLAPVLGLGVGTVAILLVPSLAAALVGRFVSYWAALFGALALGVVESLTTRYVDLPGWGSATPLLVVVAVLALRRGEPLNRLGGRAASRVPHDVGSVRLLGVAATLLVGVVVLGSPRWVDAATTSLGWSLLALSLVVLIGYANQISLAQLSIAGLAGFVTVRLAIGVGLPFVLAPAVGAIVGAAIGVVVGLPALRLRGINLAVVTLALGFAVQRVVFENTALTGGFAGLTLDEPSILGQSFSATSAPRAYATFALVWTLVGFGGVAVLRRSTLGRQLVATRTNERAAASLGIGVAHAKLLAFAISSALAGVGGVLLTFRQTAVTFQVFELQQSINLVPIAVLGGIASLAGALIAGVIAGGGVLMQVVDQIGVSTHRVNLVLGVGLVIALWLHPNGIAGLGRRRPRHPMFERAVGRQPAALSIEGVTVTFGGVTAVSDVSLAVTPGLVVGLIGPNGAGKTSLLDAISGFAGTGGGRVHLGPRDLTGMPAHQRARQGLARSFQGLELFEDLTVAENLRLAAEMAGLPPRALPPVARSGLDHFDLHPWLDRVPAELPQGVRRAVALTRALASDPAVLLLDEPGAGLDRSDSITLARQVRALAVDSGLGVLLIDHDMGLVLEACDRVVVLDQGCQVAEGTPSEISADPQVRDAYLGATAHPPAPQEHSCAQEEMS